MTARHYSSTATPTELVGDISSTVTTITVAALSGYPSSFPYTIAADPDTDSEELMDVTAAVGFVLTVVRGVAGMTGIGHKGGAVIEHRTSHRDYQEPQDHIAATSTVHGTTSGVVGTSDSQTLTNKTIDGGSNTLTGITSGSIVSLVQSKVTGLVTALAALFTKPATDFAIGSIIVGTGSGTYDTLPSSGVAGDVLTVQPGGALAYVAGTAGLWTAYTPVLHAATTDPTIGNGTITGRYFASGKSLTVHVDYVAGSTTAAGLGALRFSLPLAALHGGVGAAHGPLTSILGPVPTSVYADAGGGYVTVSGIDVFTSAGTALFGTHVDASSVVVGQNASEIHFTITYEVA